MHLGICDQGIMPVAGNPGAGVRGQSRRHPCRPSATFRAPAAGPLHRTARTRPRPRSGPRCCPQLSAGAPRPSAGTSDNGRASAFGGRLQAPAVLAELSHGLGHNASSTKAQTCRARPQTSGKKLGRRSAGWRTYPLWRNRSISIPGLSHCRKRCAAPSKGATFGPLAYEDCRSRLLRGRTPHPGATCQRAEWLMLQLV